MSRPGRQEQEGRGLLTTLRSLMRDRRGVGAVEFALLAPLLLMIYITVFELTIGFSVAKRTSRAVSTIADLMTQQTTVNKAELATMPDVVASIFVPYGVPFEDGNPSKSMQLKITGIDIDASENAKVAWSWDQDGGKPYVVGSDVEVPSGMRQAETFLVRAELAVPHELLMFMGVLPSHLKEITIRRESFFQHRRLEEDITCSDC